MKREIKNLPKRVFQIISSEPYSQKFTELLTRFGVSEDLIESFFDLYYQLLFKEITPRQIKEKLEQAGFTNSQSIAAEVLGYLFLPLENYLQDTTLTINSLGNNLAIYQNWSDFLHSPYIRFQDDFDELFEAADLVDLSLEQKQKVVESLLSALRGTRQPAKAAQNLLDPQFFGTPAPTPEQIKKLFINFSAISDSYKYLTNNSLESFVEYTKDFESELEDFKIESNDTSLIIGDLVKAIEEEDGLAIIAFLKILAKQDKLGEALNSISQLMMSEIADYYQKQFFISAIQSVITAKDEKILFILLMPYIFQVLLGRPTTEAGLLMQYIINDLPGNHKQSWQKLVFYDEIQDAFIWSEIKEQNGKLVISAIGGSAYGGSQ